MRNVFVTYRYDAVAPAGLGLDPFEHREGGAHGVGPRAQAAGAAKLVQGLDLAG